MIFSHNCYDHIYGAFIYLFLGLMDIHCTLYICKKVKNCFIFKKKALCNGGIKDQMVVPFKCA